MGWVRVPRAIPRDELTARRRQESHCEPPTPAYPARAHSRVRTCIAVMSNRNRMSTRASGCVIV